MGETTQRKREGEVWRSMTEEGEKKEKGCEEMEVVETG